MIISIDILLFDVSCFRISTSLDIGTKILWDMCGILSLCLIPQEILRGASVRCSFPAGNGKVEVSC